MYWELLPLELLPLELLPAVLPELVGLLAGLEVELYGLAELDAVCWGLLLEYEL